jgi:RHS repeat-associated protein
VVERRSYEPFGGSAGSSRTRYDFTGRERDALTGLIYYRARWYDPAQGRFVSEDPAGFDGGLDKYAYVSNDPVNKTDPLGLYEIDVHYYLTYFLAQKTGCFTDAEARLIADADQGTDENPHTSPAYGWTAKQRAQNRTYHALHPGAAEGVGSPTLWQEAMNGPTNYVGPGRYMHYLQDTFSHAGYDNDTYGHAAAFHYYDKTDSDVPKALRMAGATWRALNDYAKRKKCGCQGTWDPSWWKQVQDFARQASANFNALTTIDADDTNKWDLLNGWQNFYMSNNPMYLQRKVQILGVPMR